MKSFVKTLSIAIGSAVFSIYIYDINFNTPAEGISVNQPEVTLIPANYTYTSNKLAAELSHFTVASEKTINAVVLVINTSS